MKAVEIENLSKTYSGGKTAVNAVSLTLEQGEIFGFLGPNGAGKTTAVKLLNGMLAPTAGSCLVLGIDPSKKPEEISDIEKLLALLPMAEQTGSMSQTIIKLLMNNIMPVFFLMIPIMASSVMAASSFVWEKEKRTLETLLYCPLPLPKLFQAKIWASFLMSMIVSFASFFCMTLVMEIEIVLTMGSFVLPSVSWLIIMFLVSPAISLIAITAIVRGSAKAQTAEEAQQRTVFLILPVLLLVIGQFTGILLVSTWILLGLGIVLALIAGLLMREAMGKFDYERLLR